MEMHYLVEFHSFWYIKENGKHSCKRYCNVRRWLRNTYCKMIGQSRLLFFWEAKWLLDDPQTDFTTSLASKTSPLCELFAMHFTYFPSNLFRHTPSNWLLSVYTLRRCIENLTNETLLPSFYSTLNVRGVHEGVQLPPNFCISENKCVFIH